MAEAQELMRSTSSTWRSRTGPQVHAQNHQTHSSPALALHSPGKRVLALPTQFLTKKSLRPGHSSEEDPSSTALEGLAPLRGSQDAPKRRVRDFGGAEEMHIYPLGWLLPMSQSDWRQGSTVPLHLASNTQSLQVIWQVPAYHNGQKRQL